MSNAQHAPKKTSRRKQAATSAERTISRYIKPHDLSIEEWQIRLRRQYAQKQKFRLKNLGGEPVFSTFQVFNPLSGQRYQVVIRGAELGWNRCSCPDFAVNSLGTCKHIEYVLQKLSSKASVRALLDDGYHPPFSELFLRYGGKRDVVLRQGSDCPSSLARAFRRYFNADGVLQDEAYRVFDSLFHRGRMANHEVRCDEDVLHFIAEVRDLQQLRRKVSDLFPKNLSSALWNRLVRGNLPRYQREGAFFAARAGRSIIADDMGLGKTVQAIAAIETLERAVGIERVLVICPTSVMGQWKREIERFSKKTAQIVSGPILVRATAYQAPSFYKIVSYHSVYRDRESIDGWKPDVVVVDEAQRIKNWETRTARSVKAIRSPYVLVLTGTPIENRLSELHSIVEYVDKFRLGPLYRFLHTHQIVDEAGKVVGYRGLTEIKKTLQDILLRRTKDEVRLDLPRRSDKTLFVPMSPRQRICHEEFREIAARIILRWRRHGFLSDTDQRVLRCALESMRMVCDSAYLLDLKTKDSPKLDELLSLLPEVLDSAGTKVIVFSQWTRMLDLASENLVRQGISYTYYHGSLSTPQREKVLREFRESSSTRVLLCSNAGGVGLNLQQASVVINLDIPWNPAVLEQRIGRAHRLGQEREVYVINLVAQGSIEESLLATLKFKRALFQGALEGTEDQVFLEGSGLKRFMECVESLQSGITEAVDAESESIMEVETKESMEWDTPVNSASSRVNLSRPPQSDMLRSVFFTIAEFFERGLSDKHLSSSKNVRAGFGEYLREVVSIESDEDKRPFLKINLKSPERIPQVVDEVLRSLARLFSE